MWETKSLRCSTPSALDLSHSMWLCVVIHVCLPTHFFTSARRLVRREVVSLALQGSRTYYGESNGIKLAPSSNIFRQAVLSLQNVETWKFLEETQNCNPGIHCFEGRAGVSRYWPLQCCPGRQESWGLFNTNHPATCGLSHLFWSRGITWAQHYIRVPGELRVGSMDSVDWVEHLENKQVLFLMKCLKVVNPPYSFIWSSTVFRSSSSARSIWGAMPLTKRLAREAMPATLSASESGAEIQSQNGPSSTYIHDSIIFNKECNWDFKIFK